MALQEHLQQLLSVLLNPAVLIAAIVVTIILVKKNKEYKSGAYYQITKLPYSSVKRDLGRYGEYLTYKYLKHFEKDGAKFLFNVYVPKENGETTEIDVLMLCSKGVFVFESKNYSGWIFGSESQKNWYQTLPKGRGRSHKEHFFNPIMQNGLHIRHLKALLDEQVPMQSIIVFSDRCTLKSIQIKSSDVYVINRRDVSQVVTAVCGRMSAELLSEDDIMGLYNRLYPYTQVDIITKAQHIANIRNNQSSQSSRQTTTSVLPVLDAEQVVVSATEPLSTEKAVPDHTEMVADKVEVINSPSPESQPNESENEERFVFRCPKCNGKLVLRTATRGVNAGNRFYGCSNYPKCRYIQNITTNRAAP